MNLPSVSNLRTRLLGLVLVVVLPALGLIIFHAFEQRDEKASDAKQEAFNLATLLAESHKQLIEATRHTLVALTQFPAVTRNDPERCQQFLGSVLAEFAQYANFGIAARNGDIICSAVPMDSAVNIADRLYFRDAIKTKKFAVGEYQIGRVTKQPTLNFGYPRVNARGEVDAVIYAAIDLKWLEMIAAEIKLPQHATITMMDSKGIVLARIPDPDGWTGKSAAQTAIGKTVLTKKTGTAREAGLDQKNRLYGFTTLAIVPNDAGLFLWVSIPEEIAFAEVNRKFTRDLLLLGGSTLLMLIAAWFGSDVFVLRRVDSLITATETLAAGDMTARARLPSDRGELGQLGRSFNKMADSLAKRYSELQTLRDIDLTILSTLDMKAVLDLLLERIDIHLPYSAVTVALWDETAGSLRPAAWRNIELIESTRSTGVQRHDLPNLVANYKAPLALENIHRDAQTDDAASLAEQGFASYFGIPLRSKGDMLGVLSFYTKDRHRFTNEEMEFLKTLAGQASIAIYNSKLYGQTQQQARELRRANQAKDDFLGVMSHELRTPLNVILGYAELIKAGTMGSVSANQEQALAKIREQTSSLLSLVNQILTATEIDSSLTPVGRDPIDVVELLDDLRSTYSATPSKNDVVLGWDYPANLPPIKTDGTKLKHILHNLIGNAIKFTEVGSVTISAAHRDETNSLEFRVADTGPGIPRELQSVIFEKFRQRDSSTVRDYEGIGLGLYIAKQFATMLGGQITVESEPGKGSQFTVIVPYWP